MKVLLLGDTGSLGKQFKALFVKKKIKFLSVNRKKFKNINYSLLKSLSLSYKPNLIINCVALTGLIFCENKKKEAYKINTTLPQSILKIIKNKNIKFLHFSTEAVFEGNKKNKVYSELDKPKPNTIYGKSKLEADKKILKQKNTLIIRLPLLFGPTHKNQIVDRLLKMVKKGRKIYVADDVYSTPIYTPELCKFIYSNFMKQNKPFKFKLVHLTGSKLLSMYELIFNLSKNIKRVDKDQIMKVKDAFFETGIKVKPKNLGLTSQHKNCIKKIKYNVAKYLV